MSPLLPALVAALALTTHAQLLRVYGAQPVSASINTNASTLADHLEYVNTTLARAALQGSDLVIFPELYYQVCAEAVRGREGVAEC